jgi:hypothetical protein
MVLEGDANTHFFHSSANSRRRKTRICSLETENGIISEQQDICKHIVEFYKNLFGSSPPTGAHLGVDFWQIGDKIQ